MKNFLLAIFLCVTPCFAQISGNQGAIAGPLQNLPTFQLSFLPLTGPGAMDPNLAFLVLDNEFVGGVPHLLLKAPSGPNSFTTVTDLSSIAGGGVFGSGTSGILPIWTSASTIGNSPISHSSVTTTDSDAEFNLSNTGGLNRFSGSAASADTRLQDGPSTDAGGAYVEVLHGTLGQVSLVPYNFTTSAVLRVIGNSTVGWMVPPSTNFAGLSPIVSAGATSGATVYCSDCTVGSHPCTNSGAGTIATYNGSAWNCE